MATTGIDTVEKVRRVIYKACMHLDDSRWEDWLALCDKSFNYSIRVFSPEIKTDMTYLGGSWEHMQALAEMLPKHNSDNSPLKRHCTVYDVDVAADGKSATAVTSLAVYQVMLDGINSHVDAGSSNLFMIGKYHDKFVIDGDDVKFVERVVRLENRRLDKGSHFPI